MFSVDANERHISNALIRRRALRAASDQGLRYLSLHKAHFSRIRSHLMYVSSKRGRSNPPTKELMVQVCARLFYYQIVGEGLIPLSFDPVFKTANILMNRPKHVLPSLYRIRIALPEPRVEREKIR